MSDDVPESSPWIGSVYRHVPPHADVLNFEFAGLHGDNRWNLAGEPTLYLAGDRGVLAAEWARHLPHPWSADAINRATARTVFGLGLRLQRVVDVRDAAFVQRCGVHPTTDWFPDLSAARHIASVVRNTTSAQSIIVPSIAFVDDHSRWNLVVFLDKVPANTSEWIVNVEPVGRLRWNES